MASNTLAMILEFRVLQYLCAMLAETPTPPREFTSDMGVQKWGWSNWFATNDSPQDRQLMASTSAEERGDIAAFFCVVALCLYKTPPYQRRLGVLFSTKNSD